MEIAERIRATVLDAIRRYALIEARQTVVVGVSGGTDSVALLHTLHGLQAQLGVHLCVAHLNHGFRGEESDADADYVLALSKHLSLPCQLSKVDTPALQKERRLSAQETAREARHTFLRSVAEKVGAERIALAHTETDRVETILLNLLRGTGLEGLAGFPPANFPLIRPFYSIKREETEAYCRQYNLSPRQDASNQKMLYRRNRVRLELLPTLKTYYNAEVEGALLRLAEIAHAEDALLADFAQGALEGVLFRRTESEVSLRADALRTLPLALQRRVLRQALVLLRGHRTDLAFETVERLLHALSQNISQVWNPLQAGIRGVAAEYAAQDSLLRFGLVLETTPPQAWKTEILASGGAFKEQGRFDIEAFHFIAGTSPLSGNVGNSSALWNPTEEAVRTALWLAFPSQEAISPLVLRSWKEGDKMRPRGLNGSKKLQDLFTDAKVPKQERQSYPVLEGASGRILAVLGLRASEEVLLPNIALQHARKEPLWVLVAHPTTI